VWLVEESGVKLGYYRPVKEGGMNLEMIDHCRRLYYIQGMGEEWRKTEYYQEICE
jgi:hypothetical protein